MLRPYELPAAPLLGCLLVWGDDYELSLEVLQSLLYMREVGKGGGGEGEREWGGCFIPGTSAIP